MSSTVAAERARRLRVLWLGRIGYADALEKQQEAARWVSSGGEETLLLLEHEPVFTLGRNASPDDILWPGERRRSAGIASAGFHSPVESDSIIARLTSR